GRALREEKGHMGRISFVGGGLRDNGSATPLARRPDAGALSGPVSLLLGGEGSPVAFSAAIGAALTSWLDSSQGRVFPRPGPGCPRHPPRASATGGAQPRAA